MRGNDVQLAYGERADGTIVHISKVVSGLDCACFCPGCKARLVARKGPVNDHHFGHYGIAPCAKAVESALHKLAKQVLNDRRELLLPEVVAKVGDRTLTTYPQEVHRFDDAVLEYHLDDIVPDVIVRKGTHRLLVEIYVTHRCGPDKISYIRGRGFSCLEIDLRRMPRGATQAQVEEALLSSARRYWIHNPKVALAMTKLEAQLEREAEAERQAAAEKAREAERRLAQLAAKIARVRDSNMPRPDIETDAVRAVRAYGYGKHIGIRLIGDFCFAVPAGVWQAAVLQAYVIDLLADRRASYCGFQTRDAFAVVKQGNMLRTNLPSYYESAEEQALMDRVPGFRSPYQLVEAYLHQLQEDGLLRRQSRGWAIPQQAQWQWEDHKRRKTERDSRERLLREALGAILRVVPPHEKAEFSVDAWWSQPHAILGRSIAAALADDDHRLSEVSSRVYSLEAMFVRNGKVVEDLCGLPVAAARTRLIEERRLKAEEERQAVDAALRKEQADRVTKLVAAAHEGLGVDAEPWLATPQAVLGNFSPGSAAARSFEALHECLTLLTPAVETQRSAREGEKLRAQLLSLAERLRKPDHARVFLTSPHPKWQNRHPLTCCVDQSSFDKVKRTMLSIAG